MGEGGRFEGGFWGKSSWRDVENIIFIKYSLKKYSHIEPESLLQEFNTNTAAIRCFLTLTYLLWFWMIALYVSHPSCLWVFWCAIISLYNSTISEIYSILFKMSGPACLHHAKWLCNLEKHNTILK